MESSTSIRIDKWLWAVRLFKTRSLAAKACSAGKIKRGTSAMKPSAAVQIGDHLEIPAADASHKRHIEVIHLHEKRVGAPIARVAYTDHTSADILEEANKKRAENRQNRLLRKEGDQGRMTKKQMRDWKKGLHSYRKQQDEL